MTLGEGITYSAAIVGAAGVVLGIVYRVVPKKILHKECEKVNRLEREMAETNKTVRAVLNTIAENSKDIELINQEDRHQKEAITRIDTTVGAVFKEINTIKNFLMNK